MCVLEGLEAYHYKQAIHGQLAELSQSHSDVSKDLERERLAGRLTQGEAESWKQQYLGLQQAIDRSSFVLVLVDADADAYMVRASLTTSGKTIGADRR